MGWAVLAAAVAAAWLLRSAAAQAQPEAPPELVVQGAEVYTAQCATCHGLQGEGGVIPGTDDPAPPLVGTAADDVTLAYLDLVMRVGRMPPPDNEPYDNRDRTVRLDEQQRSAVLAFLAEQFDVSGEVPEPLGGDPANGREVFATNCAQCHGSTGAGGVAGAGAWTPPVVDRDSVAIVEAIRIGPFEMPAFNREQISDAEAGDIAAFLHEVSAEPRTPFGLVELNPVYASGFAAVFVLVVLLMLLVVAGRPFWFPDPEGQHQPKRDAEQAEEAP